MQAYTAKTPHLVAEMLHEYGELAREAIKDFLPLREPRRYLYDLIADYPARGGRMMRPSICIAAARAHGADPTRALHCATSIELLHNALLVIDDIQDGSEHRRGQPSLHQLHGVPVALNVGSTMSILSLVPLLENVWSSGPITALRIFEQAIKTARDCAEGQALELGWRLDNRLDLDESDYLDMVLKKTCSYSTILPLYCGVLIGARSHKRAAAMLNFGYLLGAVFQIQDDLLNLEGDLAQYGKERYGDLWEGKRTLLTIHLYRAASTEERGFVTRFMGTPREQKTSTDVERVFQLMRKYDCCARARAFAQGLVGAALHEFCQTLDQLPHSRDKQFLRGLCTWVIEQN